MHTEPRELLVAVLGLATLEQVCRALVPGLAAAPFDLVILGGAAALVVLLARNKPCVESSAP